MFLPFGLFSLLCVLVWEPLHYGRVSPHSSQHQHHLLYQHGPLIGQKKKMREEYVTLQEKYALYTNVNEFLSMPEALKAIVTRTISLLTANV